MAAKQTKPWFLARDKTAKLMGLDATETRHWLGEAFKVLVDCGVLEVVTPCAKGVATEYRYVMKDQGQ